MITRNDIINKPGKTTRKRVIVSSNDTGESYSSNDQPGKRHKNNAQEGFGQTPLHDASRCGHLEVVEAMLNSNID